jgi:hypothetical protein
MLVARVACIRAARFIVRSLRVPRVMFEKKRRKRLAGEGEAASPPRLEKSSCSTRIGLRLHIRIGERASRWCPTYTAPDCTPVARDTAVVAAAPRAACPGRRLLRRAASSPLCARPRRFDVSIPARGVCSGISKWHAARAGVSPKKRTNWSGVRRVDSCAWSGSYRMEMAMRSTPFAGR